MSDTTATTGRGWLNTLADKSAEHELHRLPEAMSDPFSSLADRLNATLENYRFTAEPRPLIDWAVAQTGLEQEFKRYVYYRHKHLVELVKTIRQEGKRSLLDEAVKKIKYPGAKAALQAALRD